MGAVSCGKRRASVNRPGVSGGSSGGRRRATDCVLSPSATRGRRGRSRRNAVMHIHAVWVPPIPGRYRGLPDLTALWTLVPRAPTRLCATSALAIWPGAVCAHRRLSVPLRTECHQALCGVCRLRLRLPSMDSGRWLIRHNSALSITALVCSFFGASPWNTGRAGICTGACAPGARPTRFPTAACCSSMSRYTAGKRTAVSDRAVRRPGGAGHRPGPRRQDHLAGARTADRIPDH
jgi:hypothetical protein